MTKIRFTAPAVVFDFHSEEATDDETPVVEEAEILKSLHGLESKELFSDYMSDGGDQTLPKAGVSGGQLRFEYDEKSKQLYGVTEYSAPRGLSESELATLKDYTVGQWSDGIGSNFFQERMDKGLAPQTIVFDDKMVSVEQRS